MKQESIDIFTPTSPLRLLLFDVDGTIQDRESEQYLPGVLMFFYKLRTTRANGHPVPDVALVTNQGGPACRDQGWGEQFPSLAQVEARMARILQDIAAGDPSPPVYMALAYQSKSGNWYYPKDVPENDRRLNCNWRKPESGMLQQAMQDLGCHAYETMMIGDSLDDEIAASRCGVWFKNAREFFGPWGEPYMPPPGSVLSEGATTGLTGDGGRWFKRQD